MSLAARIGQEIERQIQEEKDFLTDGRASDFVDYKVRVSRIRTLEDMKVFFKQAMRTEDDD